MSADNESQPSARGQLAGRRRMYLASAAIVIALGYLVFNGLANSTVYFKTADEAVADRKELGDRRFRIEGKVVAGTIEQLGERVSFAITENGVSVPVRHAGDPPELFRPNIPVVLEGRFAGTTFESDRIMVKHSSEYRAENPKRVQDYKSP